MVMTKKMKVSGGVVEMTFTPNEIKELTVDQKVNRLRMDILNLETELFRMLNPKDENDEDFLPPGNEIPFNFGTKKYNDMMYNINVSITDLENVKYLAEEINKKK